MSEPYTPTTDDVRNFYAHDPLDEYNNPIAYPSHVRLAKQAFDRWLAAHDAEVERRRRFTITDEMVKRGSKQAHLPRHGNVGQVVGCGCMDRDFYVGEFWSEHIARAVLEAVLGAE